MRKVLLLLSIVFALMLLLPSSSRAQGAIAGQACGTSGLSSFNPTTGQALQCQGNPLVWVCTSNCGGGGGGLTQVATTPTACAAGAQFYNTTLQQFVYCPATNTPITISGNVIQAQSAKIFLDGTVTNGSATITSAGQANFLCPNAVYPCSTVGSGSDVGLKIFATNVCNGAQCDFINDVSSVTILPSTQTKVGRIATVNSATSVTVDCAAPGNCVSPNASASSTVGDAVVLYGPDSTTAINNAIATALTSPGCPAVIIPQGIYFFNLPIDATTPASTASCNNNSLIHNVPQATQYAGGGGLTIIGQGRNSSILVPTPDFTNPVPTTSCVGGSSINQTWLNFSISGFGQSLLGAGFAPCSNLIGTGSYNITNVTLHGWGTRSGSTIGLAVGNGYNHLNNVEVFAIGGNVACSVAGAENTFVDVVCGGGGGTGGDGALTVQGGGTLQSSNSVFVAGNPTNSPQIEVQNTGIWVSSNDQITAIAANSAPSDIIKIDTGGIAYITNMYDFTANANSNGLETVGTGKVWLAGYHQTGGSAHQAVTNAGTIFDGGNNTFSGPITSTGLWAGVTNSATGTACATGNFALTSGWGTSSVASVTANGDIKGCHVTITGAAGAASPVLTWTYPNAPPVAPPSCHIVGVSGTLTGVVVGTPGATTVAFTFAGTPSAQTYVFDVGCP